MFMAEELNHHLQTINPKASKFTEEKMEASKKQQQMMLQMQQQQQMQQRQQQFYMMQQLQQLQQRQQQQQQQAAMSRFPSNTDTHFRPPGFIQNPPVDPNANPNPNLIQQSKDFQQHQRQQMMMMMRQQQQQQLQQQKLMHPPSNQLEIQMAYQDAWRVCNPDFKRPFASLEDACERLLPYHVVADYEAEEDDKILDSDPTGQTLSRCQQWDNNIAAKVAEFTATFEKQVEAFNMITQKRSEGELRAEERLMIEQHLLQGERNGCMELKLESDREKAAQEARLRMAAFAQASGQQVSVAESQQSLMARNPLRANAIGNHGEEEQHQQQGRNMNPEEMMMMMNGWGDQNNNSSKREDNKEPPLEDFLNDEENENGEHDNWRRSGEFDLNTR